MKKHIQNTWYCGHALQTHSEKAKKHKGGIANAPMCRGKGSDENGWGRLTAYREWLTELSWQVHKLSFFRLFLMLQSSNFAQLFFFLKSCWREVTDSSLPKYGIQIGSQRLKLARLVLFGQHNVLFCFFIVASGKTRTPQVARVTTIILIVNQKNHPSWTPGGTWNTTRASAVSERLSTEFLYDPAILCLDTHLQEIKTCVHKNHIPRQQHHKATRTENNPMSINSWKDMQDGVYFKKEIPDKATGGKDFKWHLSQRSQSQTIKWTIHLLTPWEFASN